MWSEWKGSIILSTMQIFLIHLASISLSALGVNNACHQSCVKVNKQVVYVPSTETGPLNFNIKKCQKTKLQQI